MKRKAPAIIGELSSEGAGKGGIVGGGGRTRASTPKYEVYDPKSGAVALGGVSRTDAEQIARRMGAGRFYARPVRKP